MNHANQLSEKNRDLIRFLWIKGMNGREIKFVTGFSEKVISRYRPASSRVKGSSTRRRPDPIAVDGWMDISSAPRSGEKILAFSPGIGIDIWRWDNQEYHRDPKPYWSRSVVGKSINNERANQPVIWQPLPAVPRTLLQEIENKPTLHEKEEGEERE